MGNGTGNLGFQGITGGGGSISIIPIDQIGGTVDISGAIGFTLATFRSVTFVVVQGTVVIDGVTYPEGTFTFDNNTFGTLRPISYDATGSTDASYLHTS
jgi:hypothetical protein